MTYNVLMGTLNPTHSLTRKASPLKDRILFCLYCEKSEVYKVVAEMFPLFYRPQCRRCTHAKYNPPVLHNVQGGAVEVAASTVGHHDRSWQISVTSRSQDDLDLGRDLCHHWPWPCRWPWQPRCHSWGRLYCIMPRVMPMTISSLSIYVFFLFICRFL